MKEIPTTSGNYSVHGTDTDFIYKFFHSVTVVSAFFEKMLKKNNNIIYTDCLLDCCTG